ncbi:MAG: hypothetical protein QHD01_13010 [Bradyrhizobium sp.]|uniref:hypothetical protein n=1 Tax=Bradyrhizobium sp. TaxID=376 RepID=UPI0029A9E99F|nr:hypothetical protein [Bradyrhizobium sp.]MDX3967508.1 hypothetical protein [Bradyrhizobium sp.]
MSKFKGVSIDAVFGSMGPRRCVRCGTAVPPPSVSHFVTSRRSLDGDGGQLGRTREHLGAWQIYPEVETATVIDMRVRLQISAMVFMMAQAVLFGAGMLGILLSPLRDEASFYIPVMIVLSAIASVAIAWEIAPRLQMRYWHSRGVDHDFISG